MNDAVMHTYARQPLSFVSGEGVWLKTADGKRFLDTVSGIAVCGLGHAHPTVARAISEQAGQLIHTSNLYGIDNQSRLAERLCALSGMDSVFFGNSGAEANEAAIKLARRHGHQRGIDAPVIISMHQSFHGRTLATLTATGNPKVQAGFGPLPTGFMHCAFNDLDALTEAASNTPDIVAVLLEPIQGEGGVNVPAPGYLRAVRELCDQHGWLMMLDEIQTGMGRTGKWFSFQHEDAVPDVMTLAKSLGNGVPIGACLARGAAAKILTPGTHGSTFGGNPLACRAALSVLDVIESEDLCHQADELGAWIRETLEQRLHNVAAVVDIRGQGLMIGIELDRPCGEIVSKALDEQMLVNVTADRVIRLLPPLVMSRAEAEDMVGKLVSLISDHIAVTEQAP